MISSRIASVGFVFCTSMSVPLLLVSDQASAGLLAQDGPPSATPKVVTPAAVGITLQSINEDYGRRLIDLERQRLSRLQQLAARQSPQDAAETYEQLFRLAIANNLFRDAEPAAQQVLKSTAHLPSMVQFLAGTIDIIASADRGAYQESLTELRGLLGAGARQTRPGEAAEGALDTSALLAICEAYHQRLLQADQFDAARAAFQMLQTESANPGVKAFSASRLLQLEMIGKPAPAIEGTDLDGKPVKLADYKGQVVLVVFWASWCLPSTDEVAALEQVFGVYQAHGFRVLGINVDAMQSDGPKLETLLPSIKRFLLERNVRWPNLMNGHGATNYAKAYGITAIPSNVLIGRDGTVIHYDLSPRKNLAAVIAKAVGP
jgi:peroxiredoxin